MPEENKPATEAKPKAKPKVEEAKAPAPEDLPFEEFIYRHYLPALAQAFSTGGIADLELEFANLQVQGRWQGGKRRFAVYFAKSDINGQKAFSCVEGGLPPSTLEPFLIDERKATLALMVFGVMQRLNAQKWLAAN